MSKKYGFVFNKEAVYLFGPYASRRKAIDAAKAYIKKTKFPKNTPVSIQVGILEKVEVEKYIKQVCELGTDDVLSTILNELHYHIINSEPRYTLKNGERVEAGTCPVAHYKSNTIAKLRSAIFSSVQENLVSDVYRLKNTEVVDLSITYD